MATPTISDFKNAFETAVRHEDDDALQRVLRKLLREYSKKTPEKLYAGLVAAYDTLFPHPDIDTDKSVAKLCKSNNVWNKHTHLLSAMVERIDDIPLATPMMAACKQYFEDEEIPNRLEEAMFDIMAEQKREVARDTTYVQPKAIYH